MVLPEWTLSRTLLRRSLLMWPGVRLLLVVPWLYAGRMLSVDLLVAPENAPAAVALTALLAVLETRRRHEHLLHANLGTGPLPIALLALVPPLLAEAALALVRP